MLPLERSEFPIILHSLFFDEVQKIVANHKYPIISTVQVDDGAFLFNFLGSIALHP